MTALVILFVAGLGMWLHQRSAVVRAAQKELADRQRQREASPDCSHDP